MRIVKTVGEMQQLSRQLKQNGKTIGFVPTMGFLHEGHLSLIREARQRADVVVVSIYVNPTQFGPNEDFEKYPRDFARDEALCKNEGVDIVFYPTNEEMYPKPYLTTVSVANITETMCGASRPGHFQGVTTVVAKLFNIVQPHFAVFGEKDFQQALVIKQMVRDLNFDLEVITAPIVREADGLAMSSRNRYLSPEKREQYLSLYKSLQLAQKLVSEGERNIEKIRRRIRSEIEQYPEAKIDYIALVSPSTLEAVDEVDGPVLCALAVKFEGVRLIDNMILEPVKK